MKASAVVVVLLALAGSVHAQHQQQTVDEFDRQVVRELTAKNPEAPALFQQASQARDRGDLATASAGFERVEKLVPTSSHAFRRHALVELGLEHQEAALGLARHALELDRSALNLMTVGLVIIGHPKIVGEPRLEASELARQAVELAPKDPFVLAGVAQIALATNDIPYFQFVVDKMVLVDPDGVMTLYFRSIVLAMKDEFDDALDSLERAHQRGLADQPYQQLRARLVEVRPTSEKMLPVALKLTGAWLAGMAILFVLGLLLSALTLRACRRGAVKAHGHAEGADKLLRRLYGAVLATCCAYYYISIPFALAAVVIGGGGIVYLCFAVGHIPIKLVLLVLVAVLVSVFAVLKSLFVRVKNVDPGRKLRLEEHPRLVGVLAEVAARVGTRPVDSVYLTPGAEVAVTERGGVVRTMRGKSERCLILGVAALDGLDTRALKAVLAHEYGHFVNRDTAGGGFALMVRRSMFAMAFGLARGGAARWWNPAWWFVNGFHRVFLHVSQGASRLQEVLADRWAAAAYGPDAFERGLRHVIAAGVRFEAHTNATLNEVKDGRTPLVNLYRHQLAKAIDEASVAQQIEEQLHRKASAYDSHPAPSDRFEWVKAIVATGAPAPDDADAAWSLFADRERAEMDMTAEVRHIVRNQYGLDIPDTAPAVETAEEPAASTP